MAKYNWIETHEVVQGRDLKLGDLVTGMSSGSWGKADCERWLDKHGVEGRFLVVSKGHDSQHGDGPNLWYLRDKRSSPPAVDLIKEPPHYIKLRPHEPIDVIETWALNYRLGNVVSYIARAEHKGTKLQDLKKARQFLTWEIEALEKEQSK
jgi:hypothetical protein